MIRPIGRLARPHPALDGLRFICELRALVWHVDVNGHERRPLPRLAERIAIAAAQCAGDELELTCPKPDELHYETLSAQRVNAG
jgi:hypothetical protein